jgi:hypothetical protein
MADNAATESDKDQTGPDISLPSLSTRVEWFEDWEEATRSNRLLAIRDRQYYDNIQLTKEQLDVLKERGQPPIVKNRIARKVNYVLGEEIRKRINPAARPRTPGEQDDSEPATDALRFSADEECFDEVRSAVTKNQLIEGYGGALKELEQTESGDYKQKLRHVEWDRLAYDHHSRAPDFGDASWRAIVEWLDLKDAIAAYPDAEQALRAAVDSAVASDDDSTSDTPRDWADKNRQRIQLVEMQFKVDLDWYVCTFTKGADVVPPKKNWLLDEDKEHTVCTLPMVSCYTDRDGNRYGIVRQLISPQDMVNKAASKTLHALNVNQVISETDAITDPDEFSKELAKPDGHPTGVRPGALKDGSVIIKSGMEIAQAHVAFMQSAIADLDNIGPTAATIPDLPSSASGVAFQRRQQAASQELGTIFDYIRTWQRQVFTLDWLCVLHYWTEEKWLRVSDDQELSGYRFVGLNRNITRAQRFAEMLQKQPPVPLDKALEIAAGQYASQVMAWAQYQMQVMAASAQQSAQRTGQQPPEMGEDEIAMMITHHPLMQQPVTVNQISKMMVDIVLDEAPDTAVLAQEEFDTLSEMGPAILQSRPDIAPMYLKLLVKASQLPNKRELIKELDKGPDPQQQQMAQQQQAMQQQMVQLQLAMQQATIAVEQTKAQLQQAQTQKTTVETQLLPAKAEAEIANKNASTLNSAADAGAKTAGVNDGIGQTQPL